VSISVGNVSEALLEGVAAVRALEVNVSYNPPVDGTMLVGTLEVALVSAVEGAPSGGRKVLVTTAEGTMGEAEEEFAALGVCDVENTGNRGRAIEETPGTFEGGTVPPAGAFVIRGGRGTVEGGLVAEVGEGEVSVGAESRASRVAWRCSTSFSRLAIRATSFSKLGIRATSFSRLATRASSAAEEGGGDGGEAGGADEGADEGVDVGADVGAATCTQVPCVDEARCLGGKEKDLRVMFRAACSHGSLPLRS
jgi:hypothetical protein